jgi:pimeloyl-ACP methyl ester carboxylesterase/DNA-binding winged helix-turn-helix (wHTH) protein
VNEIINVDGSPSIYEFAGFHLDGSERLLRFRDETISLTPKVFDTLLMLVENAGRVVSKERMLEAVWEGSFVEENNLAQNISILRRVLSEHAKDLKCIETVSKRGYRFVAPVTAPGEGRNDLILHERTRARIVIEEDDDNLLPPIMVKPPSASGLLPAAAHHSKLIADLPIPETKYVQSGDANIAYQVVGNGPIDLVFVMGWVSHMEYSWQHHLFASFLGRLASFSRLILFDKRGTGLSDRVPINELPTLEQRMEDVHAVMDAVGSERAVLVGISEGGPMCSLFAATYPEKTAALVMIGTYAKRIRDEAYPWAPTEEQRSAFFELMKQEWGGPVGIEERAPSMAADDEFRQWWATYLRMGASPGAAVALTKMNAEIDVRNVLPSIRVPSLVIHRSGDLCLKVEEGRFVASQIPGCKYVELGGIDHLPFVGAQSEILDEIEGFLTGMRLADEHDRVLATVMNVRVVAVPGDTETKERLRAYIRRQLELFRGREIAHGADGVLATFDGPARAIRCASAINENAQRLEATVRTGLHTGECDVVGGKYSGFAVDLAQRVANESLPGEILVSRTVKDLVAGSGIEFAERGMKSFSELPGEWRLFTVAQASGRS